MNNEVVISLNNVSKKYILDPEKRKSIKQIFVNLFSGKQNTENLINIQIFKDASIEIYKGEVFGIIGENGAGKSTALKLMTGIISPDRGVINVNGTVAALLEIGLGFHPDLTGQENARIYGSILGISRKVMNDIMPQIFTFAGLEGYEYIPIKKYSSGMQVRLAFAVATSINPDILLLDEVFSVGDQNFQTKSFNKINSFIEQNKTVLLVTHDLGIARELCTRLMLIKKGGHIEVGLPNDILDKYEELLKEGANNVW
jgi:ABC-2 type transport system ATP-binding protein